MRSHSRLLPGATTLALALACAALALLPRASAHGFVAEPAARNLVRNWQYCPHCVNSGGPWVVSKGGKLTWPAYSAPVCGDRDLEQAGAPVARYTAGGDIDITLFITALHGGRHQFRLCPSEDVTEACLDQNMLERADGSGPYSWTPVNGGSAPGAKWRKDVKAGQGGQSYTWRYRLPKGVTCKRCVLQWFWTTANSCRVPGAPSWIGSDPGMLSCTQQGPYPETFINCADISISGGSSSERDSPSGERRSERAGSQSTQPDNAGVRTGVGSRKPAHRAPATSRHSSHAHGGSSHRRTGRGGGRHAGGSRRRHGRTHGRTAGGLGGRRSSAASSRSHRRHGKQPAGSSMRRTGRSRRVGRGF